MESYLCLWSMCWECVCLCVLWPVHSNTHTHTDRHTLTTHLSTPHKPLMGNLSQTLHPTDLTLIKAMSFHHHTMRKLLLQRFRSAKPDTGNKIRAICKPVGKTFRFSMIPLHVPMKLLSPPGHQGITLGISHRGRAWIIYMGWWWQSPRDAQGVLGGTGATATGPHRKAQGTQMI